MGRKAKPANGTTGTDLKNKAASKIPDTSKRTTLGWPLTFGLAALANALCFNGTVIVLQKQTYSNKAPGIPAATATATSPPLVLPPCGVDFLLSSSPVPGMHLVCLDAEQDSVALRVFRRSHKGVSPLTLSLKVSSDSDIFVSLRAELEAMLPSTNYSANTWALFTQSGDPITSTQTLQAAPSSIFLFEGGVFIWPGVEIGFKQRVTLGAAVVEMETISLRPLAFSIDNFLTLEECDYIQDHAAPHMKSSGV